MPRRGTLACAVALLCLACAPSQPSRQLHQWSDGDGNVRYTVFPDRIPSAHRHTRRLVELAEDIVAQPVLVVPLLVRAGGLIGKRHYQSRAQHSLGA